MAGYVRLYRAIQINPLWLSEPFTRAQAWLDMVMLASYKDGYIRRNGLRILVKRGEIGWSYRALADRWKWSVGKVQRFMKELKNDAQIDTRFDTPKQSASAVIYLVNYEKYQASDTSTDTATDTATGTDKEVKEGEVNKQRFRADIFLSKYCDNKQLISDWLKVRKAKKLANTETAFISFIRQVEKSGLTCEQVLQTCCEKSWGSFKPDWLKEQRPHLQVVDNRRLL